MYMWGKRGKNMDKVIEMAANVVPSERQLKWQELEFYAFIHFGVNTFTGSEWGSGYESPEVFNPTNLDTRQWVSTIKTAGMRGLILTAKHHDGFCLWPSAYTDHSVKFSSWMGGRGDVVKETADACREYGIKFGIYLSPWDKHDPRYGDGEAYNKFFKNQLTELLTHYGDIFCVWFDGACGEGKKGRVQEYDWEGYYEIIRELQPNAVISVCGPDVRWIGNEAGVCRKSEWSVVPYYYSSSELTAAASQKEDGKAPKKVNYTALDIGSRKAIKDAGRLIWYPAEVDVSIRKGWFYHPSDDIGVKPLSKLLDYYYNSVGANAALLLNIPPTKEGVIHERDADMLLSLGAQLSIDFNENLAEGSVMSASGCLDDNHNAQKALGDDPDEYWHSGMNPDKPWLMIDLDDEYDINKVVLGEHIRTGQQIESFKLYGQFDGKWKQLAENTVIGYKRICRFDEVRVRYIKLVIESTRCFATISKFEAY